MVEGTSFMGLGGANLVKGATGQTIDNETLGGAMTHNAISGVAHYRTKNDEECIQRIKQLVSELPGRVSVPPAVAGGSPATDELGSLYDLLPSDHRAPYDMRAVLDCILDGPIDEFQADYAKEMICGTARVGGRLVGVIANSRGMSKGKPGEPPRFGGIVYTESAEKTAYFIENCDRHDTPLLFVQDVSGFMVGADAEHSGIIRAGARFVEAMATAKVPKIVLTINHASGAGYYAMAGQGFDPDFIFSLPTGRMGVMEGDSAAQAIFGTQLEKLKKEGREPDPARLEEMDKVRATYDRELDAKHAAARGLVDAIITPEEVRDTLTLALDTCANTDTPHIGAFVLPAI
jgi:acetyl-CoA carboxylase carboxyltransferase component